MAARPPLIALLPLLLLLLLSSAASDSEMETRYHRKCGGVPEHRCLSKQRVGQSLDRARRHNGPREREEEEEEEEEGRQRPAQYNPFHFGRRSFEQWSMSEHGRFDVLPRLDERSELLLGVANYRLAVLEAEPETFIMPSHFDADEVFYVMEGHGIIKLLSGEKEESYNIRRGDMMRIPAGVIVYAINRGKNEKLRIAMLLLPISTPTQVMEFFGAAGKNPQTFFTSFSDGVLEAAFNTRMEKLETLFSRQRKGEIFRIDEEQIRKLSESECVSPFDRPHKPYNMFQSESSYSNENGQLYEATADDYEELRDLKVHVSVINITQGSMMAPHYNLWAAQLIMVTRGSGYMELVCPHQSDEQTRREEEEQLQQQQRARYRAVRSEVSRGSVFVVLAGHPVAVVASRGESLEMIAFGVRAARNERHFLAGRNSVLSRMDRVAKQLAFGGARAEEVEEVLGAQREAVFVPGPARRRREELELLVSSA